MGFKPIEMIRPTILCFHGFQQNGAMLQKKIESSWGKGQLKGLWNFVYLDSPFPVLQNGSKRQPRENGRQWWSFPLDLDSVDLDPNFVRDTLPETLDFMVKAIEEVKPDGVLGFSQGGAALVTCLQEHFDKLKHKPKFAFIISAYDEYSRVCSHITIPTLHVFGVKDTDVKPEHSREVAERFPNAEILYHSQGHVIPSASEAKSILFKTWSRWLEQGLV